MRDVAPRHPSFFFKTRPGKGGSKRYERGRFSLADRLGRKCLEWNVVLEIITDFIVLARERFCEK